MTFYKRMKTGIVTALRRIQSPESCRLSSAQISSKVLRIVTIASLFNFDFNITSIGRLAAGGVCAATLLGCSVKSTQTNDLATQLIVSEHIIPSQSFELFKRIADKEYARSSDYFQVSNDTQPQNALAYGIRLNVTDPDVLELFRLRHEFYLSLLESETCNVLHTSSCGVFLWQHDPRTGKALQAPGYVNDGYNPECRLAGNWVPNATFLPIGSPLSPHVKNSTITNDTMKDRFEAFFAFQCLGEQ